MCADVSRPDPANAEAKSLLVWSLRGEGAHLTLEDAVENFPEYLMNRRPPHVPYTFWHQLEHIRIAQWDLLQYATNPDHVTPEWPSGHWPAPDATADRATWNKTIDRIQADRAAFIRLLDDPTVDIFEPVPHMDNRTIMRATLLVIDHTSYHLGEFVLGRQMMGEWKSELDHLSTEGV